MYSSYAYFFGYASRGLARGGGCCERTQRRTSLRSSWPGLKSTMLYCNIVYYGIVEYSRVYHGILYQLVQSDRHLIKMGTVQGIDRSLKELSQHN